MSDMREYAAQHGWEVGSHLRYAGGVGPSSVITFHRGRFGLGSGMLLGAWT